jgi:hypothetical protein
VGATRVGAWQGDKAACGCTEPAVAVSDGLNGTV